MTSKLTNAGIYTIIIIHSFQKRCNLEIYMKYIYLLFYHQKETLFNEKKKVSVFNFFFFKLQRTQTGV